MILQEKGTFSYAENALPFPEVNAVFCGTK